MGLYLKFDLYMISVYSVSGLDGFHWILYTIISLCLIKHLLTLRLKRSFKTSPTNLHIGVSEWLLFNTNSAIVQLCHGENKLVFRLLTDFVCLYNYEFWLSLCKIVRSSVILLLPLWWWGLLYTEPTRFVWF